MNLLYDDEDLDGLYTPLCFKCKTLPCKCNDNPILGKINNKNKEF